MLNRVVIQGRMAFDPELKRTDSGTAVCSFRLAVDRSFKSSDGGRDTDWINCVAWRQTAEFLCRYFSKGKMILVEGRLQSRDWTDKNGNKRTEIEVVAEGLHFCDTKRSEGSNSIPKDLPDEIQNGPDEELPEAEDEGGLPF